MAVSKLAKMRYKTFTWPHNPRTYTIRFERRMASHDTPYRKSRLEAMGLAHRVMRGEGEFFGPQAYEQFKALACLFYENTPGVLYHPVWQAVNAYFVELALEQEPRADYVRYSFAFWECGEEERAFGLREITAPVKSTAVPRDEISREVAGAVQTAEPAPDTGIYHTVGQGDTLWAIARKYEVSLTDLLARNPQIKNPNLIYPGEKVQVSL